MGVENLVALSLKETGPESSNSYTQNKSVSKLTFCIKFDLLRILNQKSQFDCSAYNCFWLHGRVQGRVLKEFLVKNH